MYLCGCALSALWANRHTGGAPDVVPAPLRCGTAIRGPCTLPMIDRAPGLHPTVVASQQNGCAYPTTQVPQHIQAAQDWSNHTRDVLPLRRAGSCRVVKKSFVLLNPKYLYETNAKTVCRHLNHWFFIKLEPGFEPSDAFLISASEPYSTL